MHDTQCDQIVHITYTRHSHQQEGKYSDIQDTRDASWQLLSYSILGQGR